MIAAATRTASSAGVLWWWDRSAAGLIGYFGKSPHDGLHWKRHAPECRPGLWCVGITGWDAFGQAAVMDDFGDLVKVPAC